MKDLSRHIEYLLCEHDTVAIPGIGVFVTEELPARYYPEESLYLPPVRSVHLNTADKADDHKLEDCLIQLHHVTRNVANKWIAEYVEGINQSLMDMGIMDMGTIGRLVYVDGKISFEVCDAGVNTPELYGLDSFHIAKLPARVHKGNGNTDHTHLTIRLRRTTVHRVMTAAAMLIVALTVIVPNYGSFSSVGQQARMNAAESLANMFNTTVQPIPPSKDETMAQVPVADKKSAHASPKSVEATPQDTMAVAAIQVASVAETPVLATDDAAAQPTTQQPTTQQPVEGTIVKAGAIAKEDAASSLEVKGFCIVMASAITNKGAEHLIAKLNKEGFHNAVKYQDKGMLRVLLTGYSDEASARAHATVVRATDKLYSGSWIKQF